MVKIPPYEIIRASRRSISIQISKINWLVVRAPFSIPEDIVHEFVERKSDWIRKYLHINTQKQIVRDSELYYLGKKYSFEYNFLQKEPIIQSEWFFTFSHQIKESKSEKETLAIWYRKQATDYMTERVIHISWKYDFRYNDIHITSALTRWGSCSSKNNLNFPWRLIMAPIEVIDYVIIHELAHTIHKNHSSNFWGLVASIMPEWKLHRTHLWEHGWKYRMINDSQD